MRDVKYKSDSRDARKKYLFKMVDVKMEAIEKKRRERSCLERKWKHGTHDGSVHELAAMRRVKDLEIYALQVSADEYAGYILDEFYKPEGYNPRSNRNEPTKTKGAVQS